MMIPDQEWLRDPATAKVTGLLSGCGYKVFFVGGCVRNSLLGLPVSDIDIATDARPEKVMELAENAGLKAIPTGLEHGTVTVVSGDKPHEVTTFRKDVETDGRRAVVAFAKSIEEDAHRRDFTMNALYADPSGRVLDPVGGLSDLKERKVRFIDDPRARIREDYLRILRYFRFHAWYGDPRNGLDADALAAIAENLDGLEKLSRERVGAEMKKLLSATNPAPAVSSMENAGVLARVLPGARSAPLAPLVDLEQGEAPDPIRRLAAIGGEDVANRLRLSRAEVKRLSLLRSLLGSSMPVSEIGYRYGRQVAVDAAILRAAVLNVVPDRNYRESAEFGARQRFPVAAKDLMSSYQGEELGRRLKQLEQRWIDSGFSLGKEELLRS